MSKHIVLAHGGDISQPSGGTNRVTAFAGGLSDRGYDVTLVVPQPERALPDSLSNVEMSFVSTPNSSIIDEPVRASLIARRAKRVAGPDATVQFEHSTLGGVGQLWGHQEYVLDMHDLAHSSSRYGSLPLGSLIQRAVRDIERRAVTSAAEIVVVSENMKRLVAEEWNLDADRITVIPNGYPATDIQPYRSDEIVEGRVTFLGTLHPKLDTEAIFEIAELPAVTEMIVIGDGAKRETLETGKRERGLDSLQVRGRLPDEEAFPIVARSAVAINPQIPSSLQKASSPVKIYYYSALGVPMVLSRGPSVADTLAERSAADVVDDDGSFAARVQRVLQDDARRRKMAQRAREAADDFAWQQRANSLCALYGPA